jgi:hypothetical protein
VKLVRKGMDMFDRASEQFDRVEDNPDVPQYLLKNQKQYAYMLNRDPPNANFKDYTPPASTPTPTPVAEKWNAPVPVPRSGP